MTTYRVPFENGESEFTEKRSRASASVSTRQMWLMKRDRFSVNALSPFSKGTR